MEKNNTRKIWPIDVLAILATAIGVILVGVIMTLIPQTDKAMPVAITWIIIVWPLWLFGIKLNRPGNCLKIPDLFYFAVSGFSPIIGMVLTIL